MPFQSNKSVSRFLRSTDQYGHPISLMYKGKDTFRTAFGGFITILSRIGILAYFLVLVLKIVNKEKEVTFKQLYKSANSISQSYPLTEDNFDVGFSLFLQDTSYNYARQNLDRYVDLKFIRIDYSWQYVDGVKSPYRLTTDLGSTNCTGERFANQSDKVELLGMNSVGWFCIKNRNLTLRGQATTYDRTNIRVIANPCTNTTTSKKCASPEEIATVLSKGVIYVSLLTSYFDQDEFEVSPIKKDIQQMIFNLKQDIGYMQKVNFKKNHLVTRDHWLTNYFEIKEYDYYSISLDQLTVGQIQNNLYGMFTMTIFCAPEEYEVTRAVITLADILSILGGFTSFIMIISRLLIRVYTKASFEKDFIESFETIVKPTGHRKVKPFDEGQTKTPSSGIHIEKVLDYLKRRVSLQVSKHYILLKMVSCLICHKKRKHQNQNNHNNFEEFIKKNFDIVKILRTLRKIKFSMQIGLTDSQRKIINEFQKVVDIEHSVHKTPNQLSQQQIENDIIKMGASKNPIDMRIIDYILQRHEPPLREKPTHIKEDFDCSSENQNFSSLSHTYQEANTIRSVFAESHFKKNRQLTPMKAKNVSTKDAKIIKKETLEKKATKLQSQRMPKNIDHQERIL